MAGVFLDPSGGQGVPYPPEKPTLQSEAAKYADYQTKVGALGGMKRPKLNMDSMLSSLVPFLENEGFEYRVIIASESGPILDVAPVSLPNALALFAVLRAALGEDERWSFRLEEPSIQPPSARRRTVSFESLSDVAPEPLRLSEEELL